MKVQSYLNFLSSINCKLNAIINFHGYLFFEKHRNYIHNAEICYHIEIHGDPMYSKIFLVELMHVTDRRISPK